MTDPNSPSHWDELASTLGATPSPEQADASQPGPLPSDPPCPKPTKHQDRSTIAPRQTVDWNKLAGELGLEPPPPPAAPPESIAEPVAATPPPLPEPAHPSLPVSGTPEDSPNFFDERFDFEEPFDLLEASEPRTAATEPTEQTTETEEERSRKRRRRRRPRGRTSDQRQSPEPDAPPSTDDSDRTSLVSEEESVDAEPTDEQAKASDSDQRGSKRRRPRRGKKRRDVQAGDDTAGKLSDAPTKRLDAAAAEADAAADDSFESDKGEQSARVGFRKIPTWEEAVGLLIDKNLETRAKQPATGSRQDRGTRKKRGGYGGKRRF